MKNSKYLFVKISVLFLFFFAISYNIAYSQAFNENVYKFHRVLSLVDMFYVDTVNQEELVEDAIREMLKKLDPHSIYISKDDVKSMNEPLQGNFEGIGIQFNIMNDTIMVVSPIAGGPSEKLGIQAGDRIVKIDGENVAGIGIKNKDVTDKLRGDKGTIVTVNIKRRGEKELLDFEIIRDKIPIFSLDAAYMVTDEIGYIKINRFAATTMKEFNEALAKLKEQGIKHLILDLRGNSGGYLNTAIELADEFLEDNKLLLYTEGIKSVRKEYHSDSKGNFEYGKVIVLIDEGSASASEIVSGAIQDWDRGLIIGRRSFGKGLVQRPFNLPDGSMMRLTIARYYTPTGRLIQKPYDKGFKEYSRDLINRYNKGELFSEDSIVFPDSLKYFTLNNKRVVYGGGGIIPDIFIPRDTSSYSDYYRDLIRKGIDYRFALDYVDNNRKNLHKQYADFNQFNKEFDVDSIMLEELVKFAEKEKLEKNEEEFNRAKEDIRNLIKALTAQDLWNRSEFYEIINERNNGFNKAVEILKDETAYMKKLYLMSNDK